VHEDVPTSLFPASAQSAADELLAALVEPGDPADPAHVEGLLRATVERGEPLLRFADALKAEAERQNFIVPRRAMPIAAAIERLGTLGDEPGLTALGAMTAADALREQGRYPDALREYDRAGAVYLSVLDDVGWARTRLGAAYTRAYTVELGPALEEAEQARTVLAKHKLWNRLARLESAIGTLLRELGRTGEALQAHTRAAEAAAQLPDIEERDLVAAEVRINEAMIYQRLDDYPRAEALLHSAADTFRSYDRPGPVAIAEGNVARALAAQGHVSRALALAGEVRLAMLSLGRVSHAAIFGQVAVECLLELNRPLDAVVLADEICTQLQTSEADIELAKVLLQRAVAFERLQRYAEAATDLTRAEVLFRTAGCEGWAAVVRVQHAAVLDRSGALVEALAEARAASVELRGRHQAVAGARADLIVASVLAKLGHPEPAVSAARAACSVARRLGVPLLEYQAWRLLGELAADADDDKAALRAFAYAIKALEKSQGRILTEQRAPFLEDKLAVYEAAIGLCVKAGDAPRAFAFAERGKTRALVDALALRASGLPLRPNTPTARGLTEELAALRRRYDRLSSTLFDPRPQDDLAASSVAGHAEVLSRELEACEARIGVVLDRLRLSGAADVERLALLQGHIYSPRRHLGAATALVQYAVVGEGLLIFVVRPGQPVQVRTVPGSAAAIQVARLRRQLELNLVAAITTRDEPLHLPSLESHARALLQRLHGLLIQPVHDLIADCQRLVIVPQGVLHGIPFAALHDGQQFLVERCEVVLAPSASAVTFCRQPRVRRNEHPRNPCLVIAHSGDGLLPAALEEGETVATLLGGVRLFEADATVASVRQHIGHADVVHVAAHGHARPDAPLFSHLRLADGQLTALDCLDLQLECELVTLSACETGHAVVAAGDEPIGLTRSLLYAGARSVIQSLWRVDDEATRRLMCDMYARLRGGAGRAQALRAAQRSFLTTADDSASPRRAHPAFWASFALVGDWAPLPATGARGQPPGR
jgi:CHAT domain-containing protein/tetratricopeptide (TPR) repeat protein